MQTDTDGDGVGGVQFGVYGTTRPSLLGQRGQGVGPHQRAEWYAVPSHKLSCCRISSVLRKPSRLRASVSGASEGHGRAEHMVRHDFFWHGKRS